MKRALSSTVLLTSILFFSPYVAAQESMFGDGPDLSGEDQSAPDASPEADESSRSNAGFSYQPVGENSYGCTFYMRRAADGSALGTETTIYFKTENGEYTTSGAPCRKKVLEEGGSLTPGSDSPLDYSGMQEGQQ